MDPISIIGLSASIVQLVGAAKHVVELIKLFKDAEKDLAELAHDLGVFSEALVSFDRVLRSKHTIHRISPSVLQDMLLHSKELVNELETAIRRIASFSLSAVRRATWIHHKSSISKLHAKIQEKNNMLHTFLSITHAETFIAVASLFPNFILSQRTDTAATSTVEVITDDQNQGTSSLEIPNMAMRPRKNSSSSNTIYSASDTTSLTEHFSIFSTANSIETSTSWESSSSGHDVLLDSLEPDKPVAARVQLSVPSKRQVVFPDMFVLRNSCRYNCRCRCHKEPAMKPKRRFMGSGPKARKPRCNDSVCIGNETPEDISQEHSRSFRQVLSDVMSAKSIEVRFCVKTFRMIPEGSDQVRYVKHGNLEKLRECIESGVATIHDTAPDGWSLLHTATYSRQLEIAEYLLKLGVETETADVGTRTPADFAAFKALGKNATENDKKVVEIFGERDDVLADFEFTPIHIATLDLHSHVDHERPSLEELIQLNDEANNAPTITNWAQWKQKYRGRSPLFGAILEYFRASAFELGKGTKVIHNLIDRKDKKYDWTPLHWAAFSGRVKEMHILMNYGADPTLLSNLGGNIIHAAVESKFDDGLVAALKIWEQCPNQMNINRVNFWGETAVHVASCLSASCVKLLLDAGADPNVQEENGQVALHFAGLSAQNAERVKIVSVLCNTQDTTHINLRDSDGRPPLFEFLDDAECVEILVRRGARVDMTDDTGKNAFHHACIQGNDAALRVFSTLSDCPSAAVARNNNGNTPLIEALSNSNICCSLTMLELQDVGPLIGKDGWAPIHYAAKIGDPDLLLQVCQHARFQKSAKTLDGKRASVVAMEAGTWDGRIKELIREHDYMDMGD